MNNEQLTIKKNDYPQNYPQPPKGGFQSNEIDLSNSISTKQKSPLGDLGVILRINNKKYELFNISQCCNKKNIEYLCSYNLYQHEL